MLNLKLKKEIRKFAVKWGEEAQKAQFNLQVFEKDDGVDIATHMDQKIEKEFYNLVSKLTPEYGFLGEEFKELHKEAEFVWTIDPIDGTKYYAKQIPLWTISIALMHNNEPVYGLIYYPAMNQLFEAEKGKGAFLNNDSIDFTSKPGPKKSHSQMQLSWDCPGLNKFKDNTKQQILDQLCEYQKEYYRVRNIGISTLSICWILTGFFGAYMKYEKTLKQMLDDYAGIILAKESGLKVTIEKKEEYSILKIEI